MVNLFLYGLRLAIGWCGRCPAAGGVLLLLELAKAIGGVGIAEVGVLNSKADEVAAGVTGILQ